MTEQTDRKVPGIQFKGFVGEWEEKALGDLFPVTSAARVHKNEWTKSGVPFFRSSDVVSHFKGNENTKAFISHELYQELSAKVGRIKKGDMLVTGGGSIGIPYLVKTDEPLYFKDADLLWFKIREAVDSHYLYTFFSSEPFRRYLRSISHIGTIAHYTVEQAKSTPLRLPKNTPEQTQIGKYFRELDSLIGLHQRKHDKLVTLKKAMLQKMFPQPGTTTPEIRFKGFSEDWVEKPIGDVLSETKRSIVLEDNQRYELIMVKRRNQGVVSRGFLLGRDILVKNYSQLQAGDFLISKRQVVHGATGIVPEYLDAAIVSNEYLVAVGNSLMTTEFLTILSSLPDMRQKFFLSSYGVDIEKLFFDAEDWKKRTVTIPNLPEQQKIGTYFRTLDELTTKHAIQLQKLQQIKSACLEKMFV